MKTEVVAEKHQSEVSKACWVMWGQNASIVLVAPIAFGATRDR